MKVFDKYERIPFKCESCGQEYALSPGAVTLGCLKPKCRKAIIVFGVDVMRSPYGLDLWQNCPAGIPFEVGYIDGTITSKLYEIKKADITQKSVKSESEAQFEEKPKEDAKEEAREVTKRIKQENPYHAKLKRPAK
jgi:hypothetical protein